jgi:AraC family transcriptional regulator
LTHAPRKSELAFKRRDTGKREEVLSHARIHATSKTFSWVGLYAEVGENDGWHVDNLVPAGHYVAFSRDSQDFHFKALVSGQWQEVVIPPKCLWIQPAGEPFSFRVETTARWCGAIVDPARMRALMGDAASEPAVEAAIGLHDPVLIPLMEAICAEVLRGGTSGARFADAMVIAIGTQLVRLFGQAQREHKGGLTGRTLRLIADFVEARLADDISVEQLAQVAQLSAAHFSRAFKEVTGQSPHQFVVARRLERARRMLADTQTPIANIAMECGFADQAHFSRQFSQVFSVSPSKFRRGFTR